MTLFSRRCHRYLCVVCVCLIITVISLSASGASYDVEVRRAVEDKTEVPKSATVSPVPPTETNHLSIPAISPYVASHAEGAAPWLVVIGIPTVDTDVGARRRHLQRGSWRKYSNVGKTVLVKYLLGLHPAHEYQVSAGVKDEWKVHKDIIVFDLKEGKPTTGKKSGGSGYWGLESEVGMSRKAYAWWCYASQTFSHTTFVMKGDDDIFLRVKGYEKILRSFLEGSLTQRVYYGKVMKWGAVKGGTLTFPFAGGMGITLSRDLVEWIAASPLTARGMGHPYRENRTYYKQFNMDHEDVMIGRWFFDSKVTVNVVKDCRYHDVHEGANKKPITDRSICIHHVKESEYDTLMKRFPDEPEVSSEITGFEKGKTIHKVDMVGNDVYALC